MVALARERTSAGASNVTQSECAELVLCVCVPMNVHTQMILEGVTQEVGRTTVLGTSLIHGRLVGSL